MPLPIDLVLLRHGESEENAANKKSRGGDNSLFTEEFREKHSRSFRLTDKGIEQAIAAGQWLRDNGPQFDRFYVSDYIRAKETAYNLRLPNASWISKVQLRERDMALMDNTPENERKKLFAREHHKFQLDPFLSYPAGGGESVAALCHRLKTDFLDHLARECSDKKVIAVCHGHVMRALQLELESLGHDDFIRLDPSEKPEDKIYNCQIFWYTRRDPEKNSLESSKLTAVRSVCPSGAVNDFGWRRIKRNRYSNEDLMNEVLKYPRHVSR